MNELDHADQGLYIATVKLGPKGQIVIPKEIRDRGGIRPGENLVLVANATGSFTVHPADQCRNLAAHLIAQLPDVLVALDSGGQASLSPPAAAETSVPEGEAL